MKTTKCLAKVLGLFLAGMVAISFVSCSGNDGKPAPETDFEFKLSKDGDSIAIVRYKGKAKNLVIPETIQGLPVVAIHCLWGDNWGYNNDVKSLVIPPFVKYIRDLGMLKSLESVTLPEGLLAAREGTFNETKLTSITLPKSLKYIGTEFVVSDNLKEINIPEGFEWYSINFYAIAPDPSTVDDLSKVFYGKKISESVALQKKLRECVSSGIGDRTPEYEDILDKYEYSF